MPRTSLLLPHTVFIGNFAGEVNDEATYQLAIVNHCYCPLEEGTTSSAGGKKQQDSAKLYVFECRSVVTDLSGSPMTYLPHAEWDARPDKTGFWTINPNGKDFFQRDDLADRVIIQSFAHRNGGTRRMRHFEVTGK